MKKCQPLRCTQFNRLFEGFWDKVPVDRFVVLCKHRTEHNGCGNEKEPLGKVLIK